MKRRIIDTKRIQKPLCPQLLSADWNIKTPDCVCSLCSVWCPMTYAEWFAERWPDGEDKDYEPGRYGRCGL